MPGSPIVDIRDTYGAAFIGLIVSTMLYGSTVAQTWFYFLQYRNRDPMMLRAFIVTLITLDTAHTILCICAIYWYLVLNFGNIENLSKNSWALDYEIVFAGLIGFLVQLFYARRVNKMSNNIVFPLIIAVLGSLGLSLAFVICFKTDAAFKGRAANAAEWHELKLFTCVGMGTVALADILIVLSMCWCLYRKRTGFSKTDSIIMTLMAFSMNTGMLTSVLAIGMLASFMAAPTKLLSLGFTWSLTKCYINSFLAILNNRDNLRERSSRDNNSANTFSLPSARQSNAPFGSKTGSTAVAVTVHRSATSDFPGGKRDYDNELNVLDLEKTDVDTTSSAREGLSESIA